MVSKFPKIWGECLVPQYCPKIVSRLPQALSLYLYITQSQFRNKQVSRDLNSNTKTRVQHGVMNRMAEGLGSVRYLRKWPRKTKNNSSNRRRGPCVSETPTSRLKHGTASEEENPSPSNSGSEIRKNLLHPSWKKEIIKPNGKSPKKNSSNRRPHTVLATKVWTGVATS